MSDTHAGSAVKWWAMVVTGTAAVLLIAWLGKIAGIPLRTLLDIGIGSVALAWLIVLIAAPWNLYFAARMAVAQMAVSRERGIVVPQDRDAEARRIARRMLWFALGGHLVTAGATAVITYFSGATIGYYFSGFYLLSATIRPAFAYFSHLRERIGMLSRESLYPREDVVTLRAEFDELAGTVKELARAQRDLAADLRRTEAALTDDIAHARQLLTTDLARAQDAQATDRDAARSRDEELGRRIDQMIRRMQETVDGISDHREVQAGIRALVRMIKADEVNP